MSAFLDDAIRLASSASRSVTYERISDMRNLSSIALKDLQESIADLELRINKMAEAFEIEDLNYEPFVCSPTEMLQSCIEIIESVRTLHYDEIPRKLARLKLRVKSIKQRYAPQP